MLDKFALCVLKDKAIKFITQGRVAVTVIRGIAKVRILDTYVLPKLYVKLLPEGYPPQQGSQELSS